MDMKTSPLALRNDPSLLKTDALINEQWVHGPAEGGANAARLDVLDRSNGQKLGDVANLGPAQAEQAIRAGMPPGVPNMITAEAPTRLPSAR